MKILITGKNGFIAKNLYEFYKNDNEIFLTTKEQSFIITEILSKEKPEIIFHCAAEIYENDKMFESNIVLTYKILEYCKNSKNIKRLVILGSSSEYGRKDIPMSEKHILEPETIYEGTKAACTMLASSYSYTYKIPIFIIRPFTIYGKHEKNKKFIQILINKKRINDKELFLSIGVHDYVYIDDFINAIDNILDKNKSLFDIVNIGTGIQTSNKELVEIFEKVADYKFEDIKTFSSKIYDSQNWVCDTSKLNNFYKCNTTLEEGLLRTML